MLGPKLKVWVVFDDGVKFGDGPVQLLERVESLGSLRQAVAGMALNASVGSGKGLDDVVASRFARSFKVVIVSTTTSTQDSGLLDVLVPLFEKQTGYSVKTISVGTGQALAPAARGEADVALAHAPALEKQYVAEGKMQNRRLVMYNDFVLIGPSADPAKIRGLAKTTEALKRIAATESRFVSRGRQVGYAHSPRVCDPPRGGSTSRTPRPA